MRHLSLFMQVYYDRMVNGRVFMCVGEIMDDDLLDTVGVGHDNDTLVFRHLYVYCTRFWYVTGVLDDLVQYFVYLTDFKEQFHCIGTNTRCFEQTIDQVCETRKLLIRVLQQLMCLCKKPPGFI